MIGYKSIQAKEKKRQKEMQKERKIDIRYQRIVP